MKVTIKYESENNKDHLKVEELEMSYSDADLLSKIAWRLVEYNLGHCLKCNQMTNHMFGVCQKCK